MDQRINRRKFLKYTVLSSLALRSAAFARRSPNKARPNIVFIMADDMGYGDVTCYNKDSKIPTPNMDRLATQGIRMTDAHTPSAVCTPTRYGVLTGRYAWRTRLKTYVLWTGYEDPLIEPNRITVASLLKNQGYATACIGKWHLGLNFSRKEGTGFARGKTWHQKGLEGTRDVDFTKPVQGGPKDLGFDYTYILPGGINLEPHLYIENDRAVGTPNVWREKGVPTTPGSSAAEVHEGWMVPEWSDEAIGPDLTDKTIEFIERTRRDRPDKPFFVYLATVCPHRPCTPPDFIEGRSTAGVRGDMVAEFDWTVGRIMQTLDKLEISDQTLLIVTSDNGATRTSDDGKDYGHKSCGELRSYKASVWEGGHRVPFIARWPGKIKPATTSDETICLTDLMATCAALAGADLPDNAGPDSYNILPALTGAKLAHPIRQATVHHSGGGQFAIRQGPWKLVLFNKGRHQLYNLPDDPAEKTNLADQNPKIVDRLTKLLEKYKQQGRSRPPASKR